MADTSGDRARYFPAIEKKHGGPMSLWFERLAELGDVKYAEQMAYLQEEHGFSRTHANALVMYVRDSPTSRRYASHEAWFASVDPQAATTARAVFAAITAAHPDLEAVIAWNQPMLRATGGYVIGLSAATKHLLLNPFSTDVLAAFADRLSEYHVSKHTFRVPLDWQVDAALLADMVTARRAELP